MPAKRSLALALALLLVAAIPARAAAFPTITVIETSSGTASFNPYNFTAFDGYIYFSADDGTSGRELWRSNGTTLGTTRVADINSGPDSSDPSEFTVFDGHLYFSAAGSCDEGCDTELWRTDGTELGTTRVANIGIGTNSSYPSEFTVFNGYLYFQANDGTNGTNGNELWRTDGTEAGTTMVDEINGEDDSGSDPSDFTAFDGYLYFSADDGINGTELWRTDGTTLGTTRVTNINTSAGGSSDPNNFIVLGDYLYFNATDGTNFNPRRIDDSGLTESAVIPGTNANTNCECEPFAALGGRLYMRIESVETGAEIAYLDEPTFGLPGTNRDGSVWSTALVLLAAVTAVAGIGLRMRGVRRN
jgi:ELWxxDGT repeat protein